VDENQIANELADKLPKEEIRDYSYPEPENPDQNFIDKMTPEEQLTKGKLLDFFNIPVQQRHDIVTENWANEIYAWARDAAGSGEFSDLLRVIHEQETFLGTPLKEDRMKKLYTYIKINKIRKQLADQEKALYG
jgi:hypothetical protein